MDYQIKNIIEKTDELLAIAKRLKDNCKSDADLVVFPVLTHNAIIGVEKGIVQKALTEDTAKLRDGLEVLSFMVNHSSMGNEEFPFTQAFQLENILDITNQLKKYREFLIWKMN